MKLSLPIVYLKITSAKSIIGCTLQASPFQVTFALFPECSFKSRENDVAMLMFAGCREGVPGEGYETRSRDHRVRAGAERGNDRHGNARDGQDQTHDPGISQ